MSDLLSGSKKPPEEEAQTSVPNVSFAGADGNGSGKFSRKMKNGELFSKLRGLKFDTIFLDLGLITDRVKEDFFVQADYRIVVSAPGASSVESLGRTLPGLVVRYFENSAKWRNGARKAANALRELFSENRSVGTEQIEAYFETACPDLLETWRSASRKFNVGLAVNMLSPGNQLQEARNDMKNLLDAMPYCGVKTYFLPSCELAEKGKGSDSAVNEGLVNAAGSVILDLLGLKNLDRRLEDELFINAYYNGDGGAANDERTAAEPGGGQSGLGDERRRRIARLDDELEYIRAEKYEAMRRLLYRSVEERRNAAFAQLEVKIRQSGEEMEEKLCREKEEKSAQIQREVELRRAERLSEIAGEAQRKSDNIDVETERRRGLRMREMGEELEGYYKDKKLALDREMAQRRRRMESEISEEILMKKKKNRTRMEHELTAVGGKGREMNREQHEEERSGKIKQIDESIEEYRQDRKKQE